MKLDRRFFESITQLLLQYDIEMDVDPNIEGIRIESVPIGYK